MKYQVEKRRIEENFVVYIERIAPDLINDAKLVWQCVLDKIPIRRALMQSKSRTRLHLLWKKWYDREYKHAMRWGESKFIKIKRK